MAVRVPCMNEQVTPSTALWPPKRTPNPAVISTGSMDAATLLTSLRDSPLVTDRNFEFACRNLTHEFRDRPVQAFDILQTNVVHWHHCLMIFGAKRHLAARRVELHSLHRFDQGFGFRALCLLDARDRGNRCREALYRKIVGRRVVALF